MKNGHPVYAIRLEISPGRINVLGLSQSKRGTRFLTRVLEVDRKALSKVDQAAVMEASIDIIRYGTKA